MKLTAQQIKAVALGALRVWEEGEGVRLNRFTEEQEQLYLAIGREQRYGRAANYSDKVYGAAGIRLCFRTDSPTLTIEAALRRASTRTYYAIQVFADGKPVGMLENFSQVDFPADYAKFPFPQGIARGTFDLGTGEKTVTVWLPWSVEPVLREVSLAEGAALAPVKPEKILLAYGDSITQGYDTMLPARHYAGRLADALGAQLFNKAIGGEVFLPELARLPEPFQPDYITVAYGTNDWRKCSYEDFRRDCFDFFKIIRDQYPAARIFAITPIWRKIWDQTEMGFGPFDLVERTIREAVADLPGVTVIRGFDFVPHDPALFGDLSLHPNAAGFDHYAENLIAALQEELK